MDKMVLTILLSMLMAITLSSENIHVPGYEKGEVLFRDDFDSYDSLKRWTNYGDSRLVETVTSTANNNGTYGILNGRLYFDDPGSKPDNHMWTPMIFDGDFGISFDIEPRSPYEGGPIISYCGMPMYPGGDLSGSGSGTMASYYETITCYHYSFAVTHRGTSHLRKCGPGLWMCKQTYDPCEQRDTVYHIDIYKISNHHFLYVDGNPILHYVDGGTIGDSVYSKGYVGIRNWTGFQAYYDNLEIYRVAGTTGVEDLGRLENGLFLNASPNPFRSQTAFKFYMPERQKVTFDIFNLNGQLITNLFSGELAKGAHRLNWQGTGLNSGIVIGRLKAGSAILDKRVTIVK
jgi:hypothetical protein